MFIKTCLRRSPHGRRCCGRSPSRVDRADRVRPTFQQTVWPKKKKQNENQIISQSMLLKNINLPQEKYP